MSHGQFLLRDVRCTSKNLTMNMSWRWPTIDGGVSVDKMSLLNVNINYTVAILNSIEFI